MENDYSLSQKQYNSKTKYIENKSSYFSHVLFKLDIIYHGKLWAWAALWDTLAANWDCPQYNQKHQKRTEQVNNVRHYLMYLYLVPYPTTM